MTEIAFTTMKELLAGDYSNAIQWRIFDGLISLNHHKFMLTDS
jgi:hypothetical protein